MRPPRPDDARQTLTALARRRSEINRLEAEYQLDLATGIEEALAAGLTKVEISELTGLSRGRIYQRLARQ